MNERLDRFWLKVDRTGDCWNWIAGKRGGGYGSFYLDGHNQPAHRVSYEMSVGPIPDGLVVDHICRNTSCVRPAHLRAVTQRQNVLHGPTIIVAELSKTECTNGHPLSGPNLRIDNRGWRVCRICELDRSRRKRLHETPKTCRFCGVKRADVYGHIRRVHLARGETP